MSQGMDIVNVAITYKDVKVEFAGAPAAVLLSVQGFMAKHVPGFDLASRISVTYGLPDLIQMFSEYAKLTPEGPVVWLGEGKLSDKELVALQLVAAKIAHLSGKLASPGLSSQELQASTGLNPKSISSRISEIAKLGYVSKEQSKEGGKYFMTTKGIAWLQELLSKKKVS